MGQPRGCALECVESVVCTLLKEGLSLVELYGSALFAHTSTRGSASTPPAFHSQVLQKEGLLIVALTEPTG